MPTNSFLEAVRWRETIRRLFVEFEIQALRSFPERLALSTGQGNIGTILPRSPARRGRRHPLQHPPTQIRELTLFRPAANDSRFAQKDHPGWQPSPAGLVRAKRTEFFRPRARGQPIVRH